MFNYVVKQETFSENSIDSMVHFILISLPHINETTINNDYAFHVTGVDTSGLFVNL